MHQVYRANAWCLPSEIEAELAELRAMKQRLRTERIALESLARRRVGRFGPYTMKAMVAAELLHVLTRIERMNEIPDV
jgi:hypothetical protein